MPAETPVTRPDDDTVAFAVVLLDHVPPGYPDDVSITLLLFPKQMLVGPLMDPASGNESIITVF
jgi:hypothetical protein